MDERLSDPFYQRIYRIFCWLADGRAGLLPSQASFLIEETHRLAGRPSTSKHLALNGEEVSFRELLGLLDTLMSDRRELECATDTVFERYINHVIKKGFVLYRSRNTRKGCISRKTEKWKNVWCSIQPGVINIWKLKGSHITGRRIVTLDPEFRIEPMVVDGDHFICGIDGGATSFEIAHLDWNAARLFENALHLACTCQSREQLLAHDRRTVNRFQGRELDVEAERRHCLEKEKIKLEHELEEERRALKDEEIVRGLATRMLEEERLKSEHMERVLQELQLKMHENQLMDEEDEEEDIQRELEMREYAETLEGREEKEMRDYANAIESREDTEDLLPEEVVWKKEDFLIISTQSI